MIVLRSHLIERASLNNIKDEKLKQHVESLLEITHPLTQETLDKLKTRTDYNTEGLVVGKSKQLFYLEYPTATEFKNATSMELIVKVVWDHQLDEFLSKYKLLGEPNGKIIRVTTDDSDYFSSPSTENKS